MTPARVLVLGSASPDLVRGVSESLAGRVGFVDLGGLDLSEVGAARLRGLWMRGGLPRSFLARSEPSSLSWRRDFIRTFLERDVQLGIRIPAEALRRFWMMLAHFHGQIWNGADVARSLGVSEHTIRRYLDVMSLHVALQDLALERAFIVYPGRERYRLHEKVEVVPLVEVPRLLVHRPGA